MGVAVVRALSFWLNIDAPDLWKLPNCRSCLMAGKEERRKAWLVSLVLEVLGLDCTLGVVPLGFGVPSARPFGS